MRVNFNQILKLRSQIVRAVFLDSTGMERQIDEAKSKCQALQKEKWNENREKLKCIFNFAVESVKPSKLIEKNVKIDGNQLLIYDKSLKINENVYLIGFGKAVLSMATSIADLLGDRLVKGIISIPRGLNIKSNTSRISTSKLDLRESSINNEPDEETLKTTMDIVKLLKTLDQSSDTVIVLISGGGSALLSSPIPGVSMEEKLLLCRNLFNSGADIKQVNKVRQKLSEVKGGGLAHLGYPVPMISLILSDIVGDPIDLIASGPTIFSPKEPDEVMKILRKHKMLKEIDKRLQSIISQKESIDLECLNDDKQFVHVNNFIIGNNSVALEAAKLQALRMQLNPFVLFNDLQGLVPDVASMYAQLCSIICRVWEDSMNKDDFVGEMKGNKRLMTLMDRTDELLEMLSVTKGQGLLLIAGGEPSVVVSGSGKGGRNQQLALTFAINWNEMVKENPLLDSFDVLLLSGGTDGQDGPTDAAGAFGYSHIVNIMNDIKYLVDLKCKDDITDDDKKKMLIEMENIDPKNVIKNNDSYNFYSKFKKGKDLLKIGFTGTNVMDLHLIYIRKRCSCSKYSDEKSISIDEKCKLINNHYFFKGIYLK